MDSVGTVPEAPSSSRIVATPATVLAPLAISGVGVSTSEKVSLASLTPSPNTGTLTAAIVSPGWNVTVPTLCW